jgi:hypothetical protein
MKDGIGAVNKQIRIITTVNGIRTTYFQITGNQVDISSHKYEYTPYIVGGSSKARAADGKFIQKYLSKRQAKLEDTTTYLGV